MSQGPALPLVFPARAGTIFDTNLCASYAHGRGQAIQRVKEARPYLRYVAVNDARTRPEHRDWHGVVLPVDDPWWDTHYPPNGWGCRCIVQQLSGDDLQEHGYEITSGTPPLSTAGDVRPWFNRRTHRLHQVPRGMDPGWDHNVGTVRLGRAASDRYIDKLDRAPAGDTATVLGRPWRTDAFAAHLSGASDADWPVALLRPAVLDAIGGRSRAVRLSGESAVKQTVHHSDLKTADYDRVQRILDRGEVFRAGGRRVRAYLEEDSHLWHTVVKSTRDGSRTYFLTLHRAQRYDLAAARRRFESVD